MGAMSRECPTVMKCPDNLDVIFLDVVKQYWEIDAKTVTVDMGAIRFVSNGADIMSPGIVDASEGVEAGDIVLIIDETHAKPLAIGVSLISGKEMVENDSGKAVETKHYVGDDIWNFEI